MSLKIENINIVLIANESPYLEQYKAFFAERNIRYYSVHSEVQLENIIEMIPINGVVLDIATSIKAGGTWKMLLGSLDDYYPLIRVRWDNDKNKMATMYPDDTINNLDDFIEKKCREFDPRVMRTSSRADVSLNIIIGSNSHLTKNKEKTCTLNVSDTGVFAITTSDNWKEGQKLFILINELKQQTIIKGTIVRKISWGESKLSTPGISIRFDSILDSQQDELFKMLS